MALKVASVVVVVLLVLAAVLARLQARSKRLGLLNELAQRLAGSIDHLVKSYKKVPNAIHMNVTFEIIL